MQVTFQSTGVEHDRKKQNKLDQRRAFKIGSENDAMNQEIVGKVIKDERTVGRRIKVGR